MIRGKCALFVIFKELFLKIVASSNHLQLTKDKQHYIISSSRLKSRDGKHGTLIIVRYFLLFTTVWLITRQAVDKFKT